MNMKKISAACATAAALAALCVPGAAFAADGTLTLNAGDGSTLAGHSFTVYKLANYNDVVKDGANVKSVSASSPDAAADAWVKAALNKNGVTYNTSEGRNAAEQLLRLQTDSNTLRKVAGTLQSTAATSKVTAVKTNQTSTTSSLNLTLPEGYYLVVDAQGIPILVSTTIGGATRMSNGQTLGSTQIKTNVTKIDKKIKSVDGTWKDSAAATNGETRDFKATFTVPNKLAVDTITLEDHMTGITYIDGSFHASVDGKDITDQFGTIGKDKIGNSDGTGFKVTSLQSLVDTYQGKQVTVTYQGKVVNASKANKAINQIILTSNWLPSVIPPDVPTPNPGTDETPVPTYDVNLKKISAADGNRTIQGAKFKIHNDSLNQWYTWDSASNQWTFGTDESKATEFSTNAQGVINFTRLGAGTYTVKETQVPTGYFTFVKPSFTIKVTDDGHVTIAGKDQPGLTGKVTNADANAVETNGAASDTTGAVTTTADDTGGRTVLNCRQSGEGATGPYADKFCWIDWSNLPLDSSGKPTPVRINVPGGHIDADATITHTDNAALAAKDFTGSKWSRLTSAYKLTGNTALAFSGRMGRQDPAASVTFSNVTPSADRTDTGVNVLKDFRLAFGDAEVMSGGVLQGHDVYEQTDIESDKTLEKLGMIGSGDPNQSYSKANTGYGTTHVTLAGGPKGATDDANKDSKGAAVVGAKQASRFKVSFGQVNQHWDGWGSAITVGVYMPYLTAYPLTYDKNASDAAGEVPSNQRGKENTTQPAKTKTNGTVKTVADTNASLPDHLVNGDFSVNYHDQWKDSFGGWTSIDPNAGKTLHATSLPSGSSWKWTAINGWDKSKFGWTSTQKAGSNVQQKANAVELQYDDSTADNVYAELCAYEAGTAIYQDIRTVPGTLYKVRLKHSSLNSTYLDKMQVMIGTPGHEQPVEMTRTSVNGHGDKLNEKSTTIATKVTNGNNRHHADQWETYEGTYLIPDGQTTTRFTFKSIDAKQLDYGNVLDDIVFDKAYRLSYDKNASDATGKVPSNQRGKENTVEPAKAKTTGTVRTVTDKTSDGLTVHDLKNGEIAPVQYGDFKFSTIDGVTADQITDVNGFTVKTNWNPTVENQAYAGTLLGTMYQPNKNGASLVLHHVGQWRDSSGTQRWLNAKITVNGQNLGSLVYYESQHKFLASYGKWDRHTSSRPYMDVTVDFLLDDGSTPQGLRGVTGFTDLDGGTSGYNEGVELVSGFDGAYVRSDAHLARFGTNGWAGATDENENNADAHGMKHYVGATFTGSSFHVRWSVASGQARGSGFQPVDSTIAYRLTYDKNAQDATGSIPSDTAANTTQPAKSETDGKVSDLVQRTTTHEDGSVTVRTVDQSTDVVSGCQVYYPAGQRITLATLAKDGDCWDSSMLTRPGHTQLGWSQDSQATQAQAEVTMVEGGMTVYAVWVGNPVLTYDTNKPNTWNGQMPSTPASVSVAYNTAAADGSGWQSGDTSKIRGYRFLGWYAGPQDDAGPYDWNTLLTGNVTVYAHWQRLQSNVVYDANGGTGSHANTTGWQYSDVTVPSDTSKSFKRDGYVFLGWDTQANGNGTAYKDGSQVPLQDKDITLYAQWQPVFEQFTPTGGVSLPLLVAGGVTLLVMGIGSTVMLTRRMRGEQ